LAAPALICSLMRPVTFFLGAMKGSFSCIAFPPDRSVLRGGGRHGVTAFTVLPDQASREAPKLYWILVTWL
jgi:hypothetical protein